MSVSRDTRLDAFALLSLVTGGKMDWDSWSQGNSEVLGREVQLAEILSFIKNEGIRNVVYITSDVHFAAAIAYEPSRARFQDFNPFWEFVIGPAHSGAFGPNELDTSFGPQFEYIRAPGKEGLPQNSPPPTLQSFGEVEIGKRGILSIRLRDISGQVLFEKVLFPE